MKHIFNLLFTVSICLVAGCYDTIVRDNPIMRKVFYPAAMTDARPLGEDTKGRTFNHETLNGLLRMYVSDAGVVSYGALKRHEKILDRYLEEISAAKVSQLTRYEKTALYINAYNAFTLKLIVENEGIQSIKDIAENKRWKAKRWKIGRRSVSLDELEHEILRKHFFDPRLHFVLVCAAAGCPPLRNEVYAGDKLIEQMEDQSIRFFASPLNLYQDSNASEIHVSELLDWYRDDFGASKQSRISYWQKYFPEKLKVNPETVQLNYIKYDWSLNGTWN